MHSSITDILFDADGVLQILKSNVNDIIKNIIFPRIDVDNFVQDVFQVEKPALSGNSDFLYTLKPILKKWNVKLAPLKVIEVFHEIDVLPGAKELINELRTNGFRCHLASNQNCFRARYMEIELGYKDLFDNLFFSCHIGYQKPEKEYFHRVVADINVSNNKILFIDDRETNIDAARTLGISTINFKVEEKSIAVKKLKEELIDFGIFDSMP